MGLKEVEVLQATSQVEENGGYCASTNDNANAAVDDYGSLVWKQLEERAHVTVPLNAICNTTACYRVEQVSDCVILKSFGKLACTSTAKVDRHEVLSRPYSPMAHWFLPFLTGILVGVVLVVGSSYAWMFLGRSGSSTH